MERTLPLVLFVCILRWIDRLLACKFFYRDPHLYHDVVGVCVCVCTLLLYKVHFKNNAYP